MFTQGNTLWKNRKTIGISTGRPPAEFTAKIFALGAKCLTYMAEVMERPNSDKAKLEVTKIIMSKLAPDLTAEVGEEWIEKYNERARGFASRLVANGGIQIVAARIENDGDSGSV